MTIMRSVSTGLAVVSLAAVASVHARGQQPVQIPQPGVPQIMTLEGKFVRVAYNNEGYVILGYQIANRTIGEDWIMLDVGIASDGEDGGLHAQTRVLSHSTRRTERSPCRRSRSTGTPHQKCSRSRTA